MDNKKKYIISCSQCGKIPHINIILDINDNNFIQYKCHNIEFNTILIEDFLNSFIKQPLCILCNGEFNYYCFNCNNYFCRDDGLYHIMISKHKIISECSHIINKVNYCMNCKIKLCNNCIKESIHGPHQILTEKELKNCNINISEFIKNYRDFKINNNNKLNNEKFINCLENIFMIIINFIKKDIYIYEYVYFLEKLNLSIIKYIYDIDNEKFR